MIKELDDLPAGVIGFEASGKLRAEDYRDAILPALERAAKEGDVRFVIVIKDFDGMSGGALWQDLKIGIEHLRAWKRIALVTDVEWMRHLTDLFGWMTPGEAKAFPPGSAMKRSTGSPADRPPAFRQSARGPAGLALALLPDQVTRRSIRPAGTVRPQMRRARSSAGPVTTEPSRSSSRCRSPPGGGRRTRNRNGRAYHRG